MRVLHLWDNYAPGLFDQSFEICREEGIETALVCMNLIGGSRQSGVRSIRFLDRSEPSRTLIGRTWRRVRRHYDERAFRRLVHSEIEGFNPDLLHVHYGTTAAILARKPELLRTPFVVSFYGFDISQGVRDPSISAMYRHVMAHCPLVHVLCDEADRRAVALGADADRIVDANLPLPIERYPYIGVEGEISRWLIPARFVEKKGHDVLLQAFVGFLAHYPDHRLTCWGYGDGDKLRGKVRELGLEQSVSIMNNEGEGPFDKSYLNQLRAHDAVLAPSICSARGDDEGGPALTAVLAQVAGKPVILSDFPGSERSVINGFEGMIVPQGDSSALAKAMASLAANPEMAREMGRRGRERAMREFSRDAYREALLGWYRRLADEA